MHEQGQMGNEIETGHVLYAYGDFVTVTRDHNVLKLGVLLRCI